MKPQAASKAVMRSPCLPYQNYAQVVARYGFAVVVPNYERTLVSPNGPVIGLGPEQGQGQNVLDL